MSVPGTILVTGATGFIGEALCRALSAGGAEVHGLSRGGGASKSMARGWACDAADSGALARVVEEVRPELVYHLAAHVTGSREPEAVLPTFASKLTSSVNLLTATRTLPNCRIVLAGSLEEPDTSSGDVPVSPYAAATAACTAYGDMFERLEGRSIVTARIFMVYGPGHQNPSTLIPHVVRSLLRGEAPSLSSGARPVDWIYIDDLIAGLLALGSAEVSPSGGVDLGSGALVTIREIALRIVELMGAEVTPRFGALPDRVRERVRSADLEATGAVLDWSPRVPLEEGLRRTIDFFRNA